MPKYNVSYLVTSVTEGRHKKTKEVFFTKEKQTWKLSDYQKLEDYLSKLEKSQCDVQIIDVEEA